MTTSLGTSLDSAHILKASSRHAQSASSARIITNRKLMGCAHVITCKGDSTIPHPLRFKRNSRPCITIITSSYRCKDSRTLRDLLCCKGAPLRLQNRTIVRTRGTEFTVICMIRNSLRRLRWSITLRKKLIELPKIPWIQTRLSTWNSEDSRGPKIADRIVKDKGLLISMH